MQYIQKSIEIATAASLVVFLYSIGTYYSLCIQKRSLERQRVLTESQDYHAILKSPPMEYLQYMKLWLFHNKAAEKISFKSDLPNSVSTRVVTFECKKLHLTTEPPFGAINIEGDTIYWTITAPKEVLYEALESSAIFKLESILICNGFAHIFANGQCFCQKIVKSQLVKPIKVLNNISIINVSSNKVGIKYNTLNGNKMKYVSCDDGQFCIEYV